MEELAREFIRSCMQFHKVKMYELVPGLNRGEARVMGTAAGLMVKSPTHKARVSDLLDITRMPASGMSRTLRGLEKKGLMIRMQDPEDRRVTLVEFTEQGKEKWREGAEVLKGFCSELIARFGEDRIREMTVMLDDLYEVATDPYREQMQGPGGACCGSGRGDRSGKKDNEEERTEESVQEEQS